MILDDDITISQSANDFLDYLIDYQYFLDGDIIASATVTAGPQITISNVSNSPTTATFWVVITADGVITASITTTSGRIFERCIQAKLVTC